MQSKITSSRTRIYLIPTIILLVGLISAVVIYVTADDETDTALGYVIINGHAYPVRHEDSKAYRHDLELYGGKWNVVSDEILRWVSGLWKGRSLAFTIAGISVFTAFVFYLIDKHPQSDLKLGEKDKNKL